MKNKRILFMLIFSLFSLLVFASCDLLVEKIECVVSFETNCEQKIDDITVFKGSKISEPVLAVIEGKEVEGWYIDYAFSTEWIFTENTVKDSMKLYCKWIEVEEEQPEQPDTPVDPEQPTVEEKTIAEIIEAADGKYSTTGVIVGVNAQSFLINDGTGIMLVYNGYSWVADVQIGDKVKVTGTTSVYSKAKQFGQGSTYEKVGNETVDHGTVKELTATECDTYAGMSTIAPEYVKVIGTLSVSNGKYFNVVIEGATIIGSWTYPSDAAAAQALDGKVIEITGYVTGTASSDKYLNLLAIEVKEVVETEPEEPIMVAKTVAEFVKAKNDKTPTLLQGVVTAVNGIDHEKGDSFVLTDAEGTSIFCYDKSLVLTLGDEIQVLAYYSENYGFSQLYKPVLVKTISQGNDVTTKSGIKNELYASDIANKMAEEGMTNEKVFEMYGSQYLAIRGYVVLRGSYPYLATEVNGTVCVSLYANKSLNASSYVGGEVIIYGFTRGCSLNGKYLTIQVQSIEEVESTEPETPVDPEEPTTIAKTVAEFLAAKNTTTATLLQGVVTAVNGIDPEKGDSFVLTDAEGTSVFCYDKSLVLTLGDEVKLLAVYSEYQGFPQISTPEVIEVVSQGNDVTTKSGKKVELDVSNVAAKLDEAGMTNEKMYETYGGQYLAIKGYVVVNGTKLSATEDGTGCVNLYANKGLNSSSYVGKEVIVYGFTRSANLNYKSLAIQVQSIEEVESTEPENPIDPEEPTMVVKTVAEFLAAKNTITATLLQGVVTAVNGIDPEKGDSFVLTDAEGTSVFCYDKSLVLTLGDEIQILAYYGENAGFPQITKPVLVKTISKENDVTTKSGIKNELYASDIANKIAEEGMTNEKVFEIYGSQYLAIRGYVVLSGSYTYLATDANGTGCVSLYANKGLNASSYVGGEVIVYGFARGCSFNKYLTIQVQSINMIENDANKVSVELSAVKLEPQYDAGEVTLPATGTKYNKVTLTYTVKSGAENATITGNKLTLVAGEDNATVVITVSATLGEEKASKDITLVVKGTAVLEDISTVSEFLAAKDTTNKVLLQGVITAVNKVGKAGSFVLTDAEGNSVFCYTSLEVTLGDEVKLSAVYSEYQGFPQLGNPELIEVVSQGNDATTKSGTKVEINASDVAAKLAETGMTNEKMYETYGEQYLAIKGYVVSSGSYVNLSDTEGGSSWVYLYANSGLNVSSYVGKEVIVYGFARSANLEKQYLAIQVQSIEEVESTESEAPVEYEVPGENLL